MEKADEIRREIVVDAPIERVWRAISSPDEVSQSFAAEIVTVDEPFRFAYRWALEPAKVLDESHVTHVEFTLEQAGDSTRVTLIESGFG